MEPSNRDTASATFTDIRATAFDYENIKRGSNACIIVSYIIKKNVMESILDMMIDELYTYFLFDFIFFIF